MAFTGTAVEPVVESVMVWDLVSPAVREPKSSEEGLVETAGADMGVPTRMS